MNWSFWLEVLIRSAVLLLAADGLRRLSTANSAAFRHHLLLGTFALLALLPILSVLLPDIDIRLGGWAHESRALVRVQEVSTTMSEVAVHQTTNWPLIIWATGVLVASFPLLFGALFAQRVIRRSRPLHALELSEALKKIGSLNTFRAKVLISNELVCPLTCGFVKPSIVLPAGAETWDRCRFEAVLLHELAHVRRHDVAAQMVVHLIAALWWFQPLVWMLRRTMRAESELACDAEVLESGLRASEYANQLVALAKSAVGDYAWSSFVIRMVPCHLERRVRAILKQREPTGSAKRAYALALALGGAAIASSAVNLSANQGFNEPRGSSIGGSSMKRTIISALLTSAGLSAATVTGSLVDASGAAIPDARVTIYNPDTSARQETTTDSAGRFSMDGAGAGQYILRIEKTGFPSLLREFDLTADAKFECQFTMLSDGAQPVADKVIGSSVDAAKPVRVGGLVAQSNLIAQVQPIYPVAAKQTKTQGTVEIEATISKDGVPMQLSVVSSPSDDLSQSALEAVRQWRYRPTLLNGSPVEIVTLVMVHYTLTE